MKRFVSLILSVCFLFSINTVSYAANISSRKASNPVIQSMNLVKSFPVAHLHDLGLEVA